MRIILLAGYLLDGDSLEKWSEAQTDPKYVEFRSDPCADAFYALDAYLEYKKWDRHISLEILPCPQGENGKINMKSWQIMFCRRNRQYDIPLRRFSDWNRCQELGADLQWKELIKGLGINISSWTVAGWVGHKGLFYNFSPEVVSGIIRRMEAAKTKKAEHARDIAPTSSLEPSSSPTPT